ncbi:hypothetical protein LV779_10510 [Streptomyces thinghirensis]|nr:hypothetical protein [Streptomyces thinghirensis]
MAPDGRQLRLTVKTVGDGTAALRPPPGPAPASLAEGPYGAFTHPAHRTRPDTPC